MRKPKPAPDAAEGAPSSPKPELPVMPGNLLAGLSLEMQEKAYNQALILAAMNLRRNAQREGQS